MTFPPLIENNDDTLSERVFQSLKTGILSLQIKPREHLIIGDIAREYNISRTPVREALIVLEREGWVEQDGRRGAKVTVPSAQSILELIEIQAALEGYVVRKAASLLKETDFQALESLLERADRAIANGEQSLGRSLGEDFHRYLARKVGNQRLRSQIEQMQEHVDRVRPLIWQQGLAPIERSAQQHWQIFHALKRGDVHKAEELMTEHTVWFEAELAAALRHVY